MTTSALKRFTWSEYLAQERAAETKSEFYDGEIFAMAGATHRHNVIALKSGRNSVRPSKVATASPT